MMRRLLENDRKNIKKYFDSSVVRELPWPLRRLTRDSRVSVGSLEIPGIVVSLEIPGIVISHENPWNRRYTRDSRNRRHIRDPRIPDFSREKKPEKLLKSFFWTPGI